MARSSKKLVVYYSLDGNTRSVAQAIAETVGADVLELKPVRDLEQKGFLKYLVGGIQSLLKQSADLELFDHEPSDYDLLFVGTPVWAGTFTPALRTFLARPDLKERNAALFCCCGGSSRGTLSSMEAALARSTVVAKAEFVCPMDGDQSQAKQQAVEWAQSVVSGLDGEASAG